VQIWKKRRTTNIVVKNIYSKNEKFLLKSFVIKIKTTIFFKFLFGETMVRTHFQNDRLLNYLNLLPKCSQQLSKMVKRANLKCDLLNIHYRKILPLFLSGESQVVI